MQHSSCCCGHYFNCFLSVLLVHVLRAANFRFLFLLSTAVCWWVLSMNNQQHMLNWLRQSTASIFFFSFIGRYIVCAVQRQLKTRSNVINALSHWITIYSHGILEHVEKEIQPISCCNHLEICSVPPGSLLVTFGGCTQTVGLFSPRIFWSLLIHSSEDVIKNSLFFFPFIPYSLPLSWHTHSSESVVVNERLPSFCRDKSGWGYNLKANFCASLIMCVCLFVTQWQTVPTHNLDSFVTARSLLVICVTHRPDETHGWN